MKWRTLDQKLAEKFAEMRAELIEVHEFELTEAAFKIAKEIGLPDFKAGF
jgi:hypothetical protein